MVDLNRLSRLNWRRRLAAMSVAVFGAFVMAGCFGRSAPEGLGLADGEEGEACQRDANCRLDLVCIEGRCGRVDSPVARDASTDPGVEVEEETSEPAECPGLVGSLTFDEPFSGSTRGGANRYAGRCGGAESPEDVWALELQRTTSVSLSTADSQFDTILYIRSECGAGPDIACNDDDPRSTGVHSYIELELAAGTYYVYVDGWRGSQGNYVLRAEVGSQKSEVDGLRP